MTDEQQHTLNREELFSYLVSSFYSSAWIQMGKMANPVTNEVEKDMEQAQFTIDLLDMLIEKTEGNRTEEESKFLTRAIKELKMNFMEEKRKDDKQHEDDAEGGSSGSGESAPVKDGPRKNIVTPDEAMGKQEEDNDSGKSSNLWTP